MHPPTQGREAFDDDEEEMLDDDDLTDDQSEDDEDDEDDDADGYEEAEEEFGFMGDEGDELEEDAAVNPFDSFGDGDEELPEDEDAFLDGEEHTRCSCFFWTEGAGGIFVLRACMREFAGETMPATASQAAMHARMHACMLSGRPPNPSLTPCSTPRRRSGQRLCHGV